VTQHGRGAWVRLAFRREEVLLPSHPAFGRSDEHTLFSRVPFILSQCAKSHGGKTSRRHLVRTAQNVEFFLSHEPRKPASEGCPGMYDTGFGQQGKRLRASFASQATSGHSWCLRGESEPLAQLTGPRPAHDFPACRRVETSSRRPRGRCGRTVSSSRSSP
jgi:hypothetical protein